MTPEQHQAKEARELALRGARALLQTGLTGNADDLHRAVVRVLDAADEHGCAAACVILVPVHETVARSRLAAHLALALLSAAIESPTRTVDLDDVEEITQPFPDRHYEIAPWVLDGVRLTPEQLHAHMHEHGAKLEPQDDPPEALVEELTRPYPELARRYPDAFEAHCACGCGRWVTVAKLRAMRDQFGEPPAAPIPEDDRKAGT
jgi:hypothetical protein